MCSAFAQGYGACFAKEVSHMPGGDGTGPMGMGPMTGRAMGFCAGNSVPGRQVGRVGRGRGRGGGRAWGGRWGAPYAAVPPYAAAPTSEQELDALKGQAEYFGGALEDIKKRIGELEASKKAE